MLLLHSNVRERELVVFFRNNHFCTMFKVGARSLLWCCCACCGAMCLYKGLSVGESGWLTLRAQFAAKLYLLVTDVGYQHVQSIVWECLDEIDGSCVARARTRRCVRRMTRCRRRHPARGRVIQDRGGAVGGWGPGPRALVLDARMTAAAAQSLVPATRAAAAPLAVAEPLLVEYARAR